MLLLLLTQMLMMVAQCLLQVTSLPSLQTWFQWRQKLMTFQINTGEITALLREVPACEQLRAARRHQCEFFAARLDRWRPSRGRRSATSWTDRITRLLPVLGNAYLTSDIEDLQQQQHELGLWAVDLETRLVQDYNNTRNALVNFEHQMEDMMSLRDIEALRVNEERLRWEQTLQLLDHLVLAARGDLTPELIPVAVLQAAREEAKRRLPSDVDLVGETSVWRLYSNPSSMTLAGDALLIHLPVDIASQEVWQSQLLYSPVLTIHRTCATWQVPRLLLTHSSQNKTMTETEEEQCSVMNEVRLCPQIRPTHYDFCVRSIQEQVNISTSCTVSFHQEKDVVKRSPNVTTVCNVGFHQVTTICGRNRTVFGSLNTSLTIPNECEVISEHHHLMSQEKEPPTSLLHLFLPDVEGGEEEQLVQQLQRDNARVNADQLNILRVHRFHVPDVIQHPQLERIRTSMENFYDFKTLLRPSWGYTVIAGISIMAVLSCVVWAFLTIRSRKRLDIQKALTKFYAE